MRAKWLQSCSTLCDPMDYSPPGSSDHGIIPGKNIGVGCHFLLQGILPIQRSSTCLLHLLHRQRGSLPLAPLGSPHGGLIESEAHLRPLALAWHQMTFTICNSQPGGGTVYGAVPQQSPCWSRWEHFGCWIAERSEERREPRGRRGNRLFTAGREPFHYFSNWYNYTGRY